MTTQFLSLSKSYWLDVRLLIAISRSEWVELIPGLGQCPQPFIS